jgi:hypothetical protein
MFHINDKFYQNAAGNSNVKGHINYIENSEDKTLF